MTRYIETASMSCLKGWTPRKHLETHMSCIINCHLCAWIKIDDKFKSFAQCLGLRESSYPLWRTLFLARYIRVPSIHYRLHLQLFKHLHFELPLVRELLLCFLWRLQMHKRTHKAALKSRPVTSKWLGTQCSTTFSCCSHLTLKVKSKPQYSYVFMLHWLGLSFISEETLTLVTKQTFVMAQSVWATEQKIINNSMRIPLEQHRKRRKPLCHLVLATRDSHTMIENQLVQVYKPMV